MKKFPFLFILLLLTPLLRAQLDCSENLPMRVIAESGLNMRSKASVNSRVVATVPYDSLLTACRTTAGSLTVDGIKGYWRQTEYKGQVGFMFDGFLELAHDRVRKLDSAEAISRKETNADSSASKSQTAKVPKPEKELKLQFVTEAYNYCGDVEKLDPGLLWYGFYPADEKRQEENYRVLPVELNVVLSKAKIGKGLEFDIETERDERSIFLLGMNRPLEYKKLQIKDQSQRMRYAGRRIFPGQQMELGSGLRLSATGSVQSSGECPEIENYKLILEGSGFKQDLSALLAKAECMPELYWYGDFSGDGIPEVIIVSVSEDKNHFSLLSSEQTAAGELLKLRAEWVIDNCY